MIVRTRYLSQQERFLGIPLKVGIANIVCWSISMLFLRELSIVILPGIAITHLILIRVLDNKTKQYVVQKIRHAFMKGPFLKLPDSSRNVGDYRI